MTAGKTERLVEIPAFATIDFQLHPLANTTHERRVPGAVRDVDKRQNNALLTGAETIAEAKPAVGDLMNITRTAALFTWVSELELNVPFQHKHGYIRDERSGMESYPYPVKEG